MTDEDTIDITGLDEYAVVAALHNGTRALGMGALHDLCRDMTADEARTELEARRVTGKPMRFDYYHGRPLKVSVGDGKISGVWLYDRVAGTGKCRAVVDKLRAQQAQR